MKWILIILLAILSAQTFASSMVARDDEGNYYSSEELKMIMVHDIASENNLKAAMKNRVLGAIKYNNQKDIGWIDLEKMHEEIDSLQFLINNSDYELIGNDNRSGSIHLVESKIIVINYKLLQKTFNSYVGSIARDMLIFHETISALGYPDRNYEITSHLYMRMSHEDYSNNVISINEEVLKNYLEKNTRILTNNQWNYLSRSGTSTGVGGGGDFASPALKSLFFATISHIKEYMDLNQNDYAKLVSFVQNLKIESNQEVYTTTPDPDTTRTVNISKREDGINYELYVSPNIIYYLNDVRYWSSYAISILNYIIGKEGLNEGLNE